MKLYFVRHGESTANLQWEFSNSGLKHPLTADGMEQARVLARRLAGLPIARIYSSPVLRAMQTAKVLAESLQAPLEFTEALREWSVGIYEGTTDPAGWALHRKVQEDWFYHQKLESKMPGGESFLEIQARFMPFIRGLIQDEGNTGAEIVLVAHGGLYLAMLPALFTNVNHAAVVQDGYPYTACTIAETRSEGLHCLSWCEVSPES